MTVASTPIGTQAAEKDLICGGIDACGPTLFHGNPRSISNSPPFLSAATCQGSLLSGSTVVFASRFVDRSLQTTAGRLVARRLAGAINHSRLTVSYFGYTKLE